MELMIAPPPLVLPDEALGVDALEEVVLAWGREVMRQGLSTAWDAQAPLRPVPPCATCGAAATRPAGHKPRKLETQFGPVWLQRRRVRCPGCGRHRQPDDAGLVAALGRGRLTPGLRDLAAWSGASWPYRQAAAVVRRWRGAPLAPETIRAVVAQVGAAVADRQRAEAVAACRPPATAPVPTGRTPAYLEAVLDGGWVRSHDTADGMEAKVAVVHTGREQIGRTRTRLTARRLVATFGGVAVFRPLVTAAIEHLDGYACPDQTLLGDGAPWIWTTGRAVLAGATPVLDRWHLSDARRRAVRRAVPDAEARAAWTTRIEASLDHGDVPGTLAVLADLTTEIEQADRVVPAALTAFVTYVTEQAPQIPDYAARRLAGHPIGSGTVEKGVDLVVNRRLKGRRGMKWGRDRAEGVLALRVAALNDEWDHFVGAACGRSHLPAF